MRCGAGSGLVSLPRSPSDSVDADSVDAVFSVRSGSELLEDWLLEFVVLEWTPSGMRDELVERDGSSTAGVLLGLHSCLCGSSSSVCGLVSVALRSRVCLPRVVIWNTLAVCCGRGVCCGGVVEHELS